MDTNITTPDLSSQSTHRQRGPYRRYTLEFKRQLVQQTLQSGASVARLARLHQINANQVFGWRKAYRDGLLGDEGRPVMLPVQVVEAQLAHSDMTAMSSPATQTGIILLERGNARLRIEGQPDADTLHLVLTHWLR